MGTKYVSLTFAAEPAVVVRWSEHCDRDKLDQEAKGVVYTASLRDWLMSEISAHSSYLELTSLDWLATGSEAPLRTTEHLDSGGDWWFVWILYRADIHASIEGLNKILCLAQEQPSRFGVAAAEVSAAHDWDRGCDETEFEIPDPSGEGEDPTYVLCSLLALRRLLKIADSQGLLVVHMRYAFS